MNNTPDSPDCATWDDLGLHDGQHTSGVSWLRLTVPIEMI